MKIHLLITGMDNDYVEHLSNVLTENYADIFEVSVCSSRESMAELLDHRRADIALLGAEFAVGAETDNVKLRLLLWDGISTLDTRSTEYRRIRKYQRISSLVSQVLEQYAELSGTGDIGDDWQGTITVVWSPIGGSGKTTVALAYGAQRVSEGKKVVYLNLEPFASTPVYFPESGKSISSVFEKLDSNVELLLQSIRQTDAGSGLLYFCRPDNYDDIGILTAEDMQNLVVASAKDVDEVIVDLGISYDQRTATLMELADMVIAVLDSSQIAGAKWQQFRTQHSTYEKIEPKLLLVANRSARIDTAQNVVALPIVQSDDPVVVYKTLSAGYFRK